MRSGFELRNERIQQIARSWVIYLHSGDVSAAKLAEFESWLAADEENARAYREHEQLMVDLALVDFQSPCDSVAQMQSSRPSPMPGRLPRSRIPVLAIIGPAIAAMICFGALRSQTFFDESPLPFAQTQIAEVRTVSLPDGSQVTLGARSRIETRFTENMRLVALPEGEAYFDVVPDKDRPFYVSVGDRLVRVVGTRFDVRRGEDEIKVSVVEGVVEVIRGRDASVAERDRTDRPKEILRAGDQIVAEIGAIEVHRTAVEPEDAASWRIGRLSYEDASLAEIVSDVNRYTDSQIELETEELGDIRITAAFYKDQIDQFIAGLEATQALAADRSVAGRIILRPRD